MLHTFAKNFRQDLAASLSASADMELPEVTGWQSAKKPEMQAAIAAYNERERAACLERQLKRLGL